MHDSDRPTSRPEFDLTQYAQSVCQRGSMTDMPPCLVPIPPLGRPDPRMRALAALLDAILAPGSR